MPPQMCIRDSIGKVDNSGVDISVDYNKAFSKDLILSLRGTFTYAHNEIVEMDEPKYKWAYQYKAGHPINSIQCLIAEGLFRDEEEIASSPSQDIYATTYPIRPGDVKYRDLNDDKIIDDNDMCWTGNPTVPEIIYGFGFSLKYKGFDCSAFFQGCLLYTSPGPAPAARPRIRREDRTLHRRVRRQDLPHINHRGAGHRINHGRVVRHPADQRQARHLRLPRRQPPPKNRTLKKLLSKQT